MQYIQISRFSVSLLLIFGVFFFTKSVFASEAIAPAQNGITLAATTTKTYRVGVVLINYPDNPTEKPWTKEAVYNAFFSSPTSLEAYWSVVSQGRIHITGSVFDNNGEWYRSPRARDCSGTFISAIPQQAYDDVQKAGNFDVVIALHSGPHILCSSVATSVREVEKTAACYPTIRIFPSGNNEICTPQTDLPLVDKVTIWHEFGHFLNLGHGQIYTCSDKDILYGSCQENACSTTKTDFYNVMGYGSGFIPDAVMLEHLGWLANNETMKAVTSGDYMLTAYENPNGTPRVLKVPQAFDETTGAISSWYYLEFRQAIGQDTSTTRAYDSSTKSCVDENYIEKFNVDLGVLVHLQSTKKSGGHFNSRILDMNPTPNNPKDYYDVALKVGSTYTDGKTGISFRPTKISGNTININVQVPRKYTERTIITTNPRVSSSFYAYNSNLRGDFSITSGNILGDRADEIISGSPEKTNPQVRIFNAAGKMQKVFSPYNPNMRSGVRVASCDLIGDNGNEIVTVPGAGALPQVKIFNKNGQQIGRTFLALDGKFNGGAFVGCGDPDGDGKNEIIISAGPGGGSQIVVYNVTGKPEMSFFAYNKKSFRGGVRVAVFDIDTDGKDELIASPASGAEKVIIFKYETKAFLKLNSGFFPFAASYTGGVTVTGVDIGSDGNKELILGAGSNIAPQVRVFNLQGQLQKQFNVYAKAFVGGLNVASGDINGDSKIELLIIPQSRGGPQVRVIKTSTL